MEITEYPSAIAELINTIQERYQRGNHNVPFALANQADAELDALRARVTELEADKERQENFKRLYVNICTNLQNAITELGIKGHGGENVDDIIINALRAALDGRQA